MKPRKALLGRLPVYVVALLLQIVLLVVVVARFQRGFYFFHFAGTVLSVFVVIWILNEHTNPTYKLAWIIPILVFPVFGGLAYLVYGRTRLRRRLHRELARIAAQCAPFLQTDRDLVPKLVRFSPDAARQARYLEAYGDSPLFDRTRTRYLTTGEAKFERLLEVLREAQRYIYLEYFIIDEGFMWSSILGVLREKADHGVDVRVIYDDAGCLSRLPAGYDRYLESIGIRCAVFNPMRPVLDSAVNHRDHRKIAIIDGRVAFTGGVNLADEYINRVTVAGYWKDTAIEIEGEAVWSFTVMFLAIWDLLRGGTSDYQGMKTLSPGGASASDGFVQPFADSPLDDERIGENVYLNVIARARDYVYITTPYLIIDNDMVTALTLAAKSGVDVRIITPHVPDRWYVHIVTRTYCRLLTKNGIRVYEFLPGFIHSKTIVADDYVGVVGTINMDYRSLFLHFECGVALYGTESVIQIRDDFLGTLKDCRELTEVELRQERLPVRAAGQVLRLLAPLL